MQKNKLIVLLILTLLTINLASSDMEDFEEAKNIISSKVSCDDLSEKQLEILGDYYMEQMHPGEVHERMDAMMGGEGSESLRQVHINMGIRFYCGGNNYYGMMGMMYNNGNVNNVYGYGFIGVFSWIFMVIVIIALVLLIIWLFKKIQSSEHKTERRNRKR